LFPGSALLPQNAEQRPLMMLFVPEKEAARNQRYRGGKLEATGGPQLPSPSAPR